MIKIEDNQTPSQNTESSANETKAISKSRLKNKFVFSLLMTVLTISVIASGYFKNHPSELLPFLISASLVLISLPAIIPISSLISKTAESVNKRFWEVVEGTVLFTLGPILIVVPVLGFVAWILSDVQSLAKTGTMTIQTISFLKAIATYCAFFGWMFGLSKIWKREDYSPRRHFGKFLKAVLLSALISVPTIGVFYWSTHGKGALYFSSDDDYIR